MIVRLAALLAAALWLAGCGAPADPPRDWPASTPAIWQVESAGEPVAWLFGTVHALPAGLEWSTPRLEEALAAADLLVVEIAELDDGAAASAAFEAVSRTPALLPLVGRVATSDRPLLQALLERAGMDEADFVGRKSWAAALILAAATRHHDPALGVDRALLSKAGRIEGLETYQAQFARFDALTQRAQAKLLLAVADDALADDQDARLEAWLTGDIARLEALSSGRLLADGELREGLVTARNRAWAARIARLIEIGARPFVAVGAGHMLGEDGLPTLLAARGFTVRRVQ